MRGVNEKTVFLCEKPSQAGDIAKVLGIVRRQNTHYETTQGLVTYCFGHMFELAQAEHYDPRQKEWRLDLLPIEVSDFKLMPKKSANEQLSAIAKLLRAASRVVLATDPDREGEAIGREVLEYNHFRGQVDRLWLNALDEASIKKALAKLRAGRETESLWHAAAARSQGDWLFGINLTRGSTRRWYPQGSKGFYSIGRVQTPTLAMVVRRDRAIESFIATDYFEISAQVLTETGKTVVLRFAPAAEEKRILDRAQADLIATRSVGHSGPICVKQEEKQQAPPKLFSLSLLQKRCSALYAWSADTTLNIAQALYERPKITTYPRTDCSFLPEEQEADIPSIVSHLRAGVLARVAISEEWRPQIRESVFNTAKVTAHHAIIPTTKPADLSLLSDAEQKAYKLIASHYLSALFPDYRYLSKTIALDVRGNEFLARGTTPLEVGWRAAFLPELIDESQSKDVPVVSDGETGTVQSAEIIACQTKPPPRYTEGTLIEDMKNVAKYVDDPGLRAVLKEASGIGTEATRAGIIKVLRDRFFLEARGKNVYSTGHGRALVSLLEEHLPELVDAGQTALWEQKLQGVEDRKLSAASFMDGIMAQVRAYVEVIKEAGNARQPDGRVSPALSHEGFTISDCGSFFSVGELPGIQFAKHVCRREIKSEELARILRANGSAVLLRGFVSKAGQKFDAGLAFDQSNFVKGRELKLVFRPRTG